jgi:N-glycosylase/DNA lyase
MQNAINIQNYKLMLENIPFNIKFNFEEKTKIIKRYKEFIRLKNSSNKIWFSELCFCILTANSQAKKAIIIQERLGSEGFLNKTESELATIIKSYGHRFHNTKAKYIVNARKYNNIKDLLFNHSDQEAREFLVKNIKGLGYKEASHFLRNVGYTNLAIIDRHILKFLFNKNLLEKIPKTITKKLYLEIEALLKSYFNNQSLLDLVIWYHVTGQLLK